MHFGQTFSAGIVPEWQSKYLDYIEGKQLIHKLEQKDIPTGAYGSPVNVWTPPTAATSRINERSPLLALFTKNRAGETRVSDFFAWLDNQIGKVNDFYCSLEEQSIRKFELLEIELKLLKKHKIWNEQRQKRINTQRFLPNLNRPSLPRVFRRSKEPETPELNASNSKDFSGATVSYSHAKHMMKTALLEYYQSLQHIRGYRSLNETAIRKINKKFDKTFGVTTLDQHYAQISQMRFIHSHKLDELSRKIESLYADTFESGNHKYAVEKLQSNPSKYSHNSAVLLIGFLVGASLPLFVLALREGLRRLDGGRDWEAHAILSFWACFFFFSFISLLFSLNILVWHYYKVNYIFIFEFNRYNVLDYREYPVMPAIFFCLFSFLAFLSFYLNSWYCRYLPAMFMVLVLIGFFWPARTFFHKARSWLQVALCRLLLSGLFDVEFRDFFLGDIFCSLNYSLGNLSMVACTYSTAQWWTDQSLSLRCTSKRSRVLGFLQTLPGIWRFLQCLRRYGDTSDWFPHLLNALKYSLLILSYIFLSYARINDSGKWKSLYITFVALNAVYSSFWDIVMDFSLGITLRDEIAFPQWTYYVIMVLDPLMRFNWVLYIVYWNDRQSTEKISFIVALIEIARRLLWVLFRVENEHCANVTKFRAFKDLNLPYNTGAPSIRSADGEETYSMLPPPALSHSQPSVAGSPYVTAVRKRLTLAHTHDFERRKPNEDELDDEDD